MAMSSEVDDASRTSLERLLDAVAAGKVSSPRVRGPLAADSVEAGTYTIRSGSLRIARRNEWATATANVWPAVPGEWQVTSIVSADEEPLFGRQLGGIALADGVSVRDVLWADEPVTSQALLSYGSSFLIGDADTSLSLGDEKEAIGRMLGDMPAELRAVLASIDRRVLSDRLANAELPPLELGQERMASHPTFRFGPDRVWLGRNSLGAICGVVIDRLAAIDSMRDLNVVEDAWHVPVAAAGGQLMPGAGEQIETADLNSIFSGSVGDVYGLGTLEIDGEVIATDATHIALATPEVFVRDAVTTGVRIASASAAALFSVDTWEFEATLIRLSGQTPAQWRALAVESPHGSRSNWRIISSRSVVDDTTQDPFLHASLAALGEWVDLDIAQYSGVPVAAAIRLSDSCGGDWYAGLASNGTVAALIVVSHRDVAVYPYRPASEDEPLLALVASRRRELALRHPEPDGFETLFSELEEEIATNDGVITPATRGRLHWLVRDFLELTVG